MPSVHVTANARTLGSRQADANKSHFHLPSTGGNFVINKIPAIGGYANIAVDPNGWVQSNGGSTAASGGAEGRPVNTAYHPRIHA